VREKFIDALNFRHACKLFDESKKIPQEDFDFILECGRLSPSSFGMEHWRFLVVRDKNLREGLKEICWNQNQITTCSELVVIKAQKKLVSPKDGYVLDMFSRRGLPEDATKAYIQRYSNFLENRTTTQESIASWSSRQCYIAAGNMLSGAALIGIDSCPIEGFDKEAIEKFLKIDTQLEEVALVLCFGYRIKEQPTKHRLPLEKIVTYV